MKDGWEYKRLGDIATYVNGFAFKPTDWVNEGRPIIRIQNLTDSSAHCNSCQRTDIPEKYKVVKGDVLISWSATLGVFEWEREDSWLNQHIFKVVFDKISINKKYFEYVVQSSLEEMSRHTNGATMQHIRKGDFDNILVPVPSLQDQQSIVEYLDSSFAKIDAMKANAEIALNEAKALFQASLKSLLEPNDGWTEKTFGDVLKIKHGKDYKGVPCSKSLYPVYGSGDEVVGYVDEFLSEANSIILGRKGTIDRPRFIDHKFWNIDTAFSLTTLDGYDPKYIYYNCLTIDWKSLNSGASKPSLTQTLVYAQPIPVPSTLAEQQSISKTLDEIKAKVDQLQANYDKISAECDALKQALLKQVFE